MGNNVFIFMEKQSKMVRLLIHMHIYKYNYIKLIIYNSYGHIKHGDNETTQHDKRQLRNSDVLVILVHG